MPIEEILRTLRQRWVTAAAVFAMVMLAFGAYVVLATPQYEAVNRVFVKTQTGSDTTDLAQGTDFAQRQIQSYVDLATSPLVLGPVIEELDLEQQPQELAERVTASTPDATVLIDIAVTGTDAASAANIANATSSSLQQVVADLEEDTDGNQTVKLTVVSPAVADTTPISPNPLRDLALGLAIALAAGVSVALLRSRLDNRIRDEADIRKVSDISVIGTIRNNRDANEHPLSFQSQPTGVQAESFRELRTNLQFLKFSNGSNTLVVTSGLQGEGKSSTAINLSLALADSGVSVLLIDADLRRPSVARYLRLEGSVGLTTALIGQAALADVIQPVGCGRLSVLTSGQIPPNPSELLGSASMATLLDEVSGQFDYVVVDTAPLLPVTDGAVLSQRAGGTVVVTSSAMLRSEQLRQSLEKLGAVEANVMGIILNRAAERRGSYAYRFREHPPEEPATAGRHQKLDPAPASVFPAPVATPATAPNRAPDPGPGPEDSDRPLARKDKLDTLDTLKDTLKD